METIWGGSSDEADPAPSEVPEEVARPLCRVRDSLLTHINQAPLCLLHAMRVAHADVSRQQQRWVLTGTWRTASLALAPKGIVASACLEDTQEKNS